MNERIFELARQSGATDENGSRATTVYCFTDQELKGFAELIVQECTEIAKEIAFKHQVKEDTYSAGKKAGAFEVAEGIKQHFGVDGVE
jgi:hypothetical protein